MRRATDTVDADPRLPLGDDVRSLKTRLYEILRGHAIGINGEDVWDDLRFPAQGINPIGAAADPTVDTATYPGTLLFSGTQENVIAGVAQMPHTWAEGTAIVPHIHWTKTTADAGGNAVGWEFRYAIADVGDVLPAFSAWGGGTLEVGDLTTAEKHNITEFATIDMTGFLISVMIVWGVRRTGDTDAYNSNARLLEFDIHYQSNSDGSSREFVK